MEIGSYGVDFVETEPLIKSQGAIKSTNLEVDGALAHQGFSLELADQRTADAYASVLWQDREVR